MSDFPWTQQEYNDQVFQKEYQSNVKACAEMVIDSFKMYNDNYLMRYFVKDVMVIVKKELKKIGDWEE